MKGFSFLLIIYIFIKISFSYGLFNFSIIILLFITLLYYFSLSIRFYNDVTFFTILYISHYLQKKWKFSISTSTSSHRKDRNWGQWEDSVFWSNMDRSVQFLFFLQDSCFDGLLILRPLQQKLRVQAL